MSYDEEEPSLRPVKAAPVQTTEPKIDRPFNSPLNPIPLSPQVSNPWNNQLLLSNDALPSYFRPVSTYFPISAATASTSHIPFGLVISPALVADVPVTDLSHSTLIRCPKCDSHICPFSKISSDGRQWTCAICGMTTLFLNTSVKDRKEVTSQIIDMIVPKNYMVHEKVGPSFLFIFDISYYSLNQGFAQSAASSLLASIDSLDDDTFFSLMTIDDKLTVYDILKNNRTSYVELDQLKDEFYSHVCTLRGNREKVIVMLKEIQNMKMTDNTPKGHCLGSALEAVSIALREVGGVVCAFVCNPPIIGPRSVSPRSRDDMVNETALLRMPKTENSAFFTFIAKEFVSRSISFHLFASSSYSSTKNSGGFADVSVIGVPCGLTGGKCHFYQNFNISLHLNELHREIYRTVTADYLWDATMKLRISNGINVHRIHANCFLKDRDMLSVPAMTPEDSFTYEFDIQPHVTTQTVTFQFALAWNNIKRQRIIRVFTFSLPITEDPLEIMRNVDEGALFAILSKRTIPILLAEGAVSAAKLFVHETKQLVNVNRCFRSLPQMTFGILRSDYLSSSYPTGSDGRFAHIIQMRSAGIVDLLLSAYPRLLTIDNGLKPLSSESIKNESFLILHSNDAVFVWGRTKEDLIHMIGQETLDEAVNKFASNGIIDPKKSKDQRVMEIVKECWNLSRRFLLTFAIFGNECLNCFLIEDAITNNFNYASWLQPFNPKL